MNLVLEKCGAEAVRGGILGILESVHPYEGRKRVEVLKRDKKDTARESQCSVFEVY
jgi:hypothetical protein